MNLSTSKTEEPADVSKQRTYTPNHAATLSFWTHVCENVQRVAKWVFFPTLTKILPAHDASLNFKSRRVSQSQRFAGFSSAHWLVGPFPPSILP